MAGGPQVSFEGIRYDGRALAELLRGPQGPVVRHTQERAERIRQRAKRQVGVSADGSAHLRDALVTRTMHDSDGTFVGVGTFGGGVGYALYHHEGTRPHPIDPVRGRYLVFKVGGVTIFASHVDHPGTRPNRYLTDSARAEGLRTLDK